MSGKKGAGKKSAASATAAASPPVSSKSDDGAAKTGETQEVNVHAFVNTEDSTATDHDIGKKETASDPTNGVKATVRFDDSPFLGLAFSPAEDSFYKDMMSNQKKRYDDEIADLRYKIENLIKEHAYELEKVRLEAASETFARRNSKGSTVSDSHAASDADWAISEAAGSSSISFFASLLLFLIGLLALSLTVMIIWKTYNSKFIHYY